MVVPHDIQVGYTPNNWVGRMASLRSKLYVFLISMLEQVTGVSGMGLMMLAG